MRGQGAKVHCWLLEMVVANNISGFVEAIKMVGGDNPPGKRLDQDQFYEP
jgi:hypothetical protein